MQESPDTILLLSGDLFVASQLTGVARMLDCELKQVSQLPAELAQGCRLVVVDLSSAADDFINAVTEKCKASQIPVLAFGPHVQEAKLQRAKQAGCDRVVTRGSIVAEVRAAIVRTRS